MNPLLSRIAPLSLSLVLGLAAACHGEGDDVSPQPRAVELSEGRAVSIALPGGVDDDRIHAIAAHVEHGLGGDVAAAQVKVLAADDGSATVVVELWGSSLPDEAALKAGLVEQFPELAGAEISVEALDAERGPSPVEAHSDAEDPDVARQEIIDELRAQGVEGDIDVQVEDGPDGRRVEVQVEEEKSE